MSASMSRHLAAAALAAGLAAAPAAFAEPLAASLGTQPGSHHSQACSGEPCDAVVRGALRFLDRRLRDLDANGRSCADCHMLTDHFQLSPAAVDARFKFLEWQRRFNPRADDPLFRPVDADDFRINGENARDFSNLRQNGLVRVTLRLPSTMKLIDPVTNAPSTETTVDVWRMVPSIENAALTGPDGMTPWPRGPHNTGGYQLDGRVGTLQEQALGALLNHAQAVYLPSPQFLDDLASFQRTMFSSPRVRTLAAAVAAGITPLPSADPPLTALEKQGKVVFERACAQCHGGPGQSTPTLPVTLRFHDVLTQCPRRVDTVSPARFAFKPCPERLARNARTYEVTLSTGAVQRRVSSDPGRALLTGFIGPVPILDDWNKLDMPGLRGISKTPPYFHNNSADTLEEVVDHYVEFFKVVKAVAPPGPAPAVASTDGVSFDRTPRPEERSSLLAYLRKL
jgi:cytochrome c peroxidase